MSPSFATRSIYVSLQAATDNNFPNFTISQFLNRLSCRHELDHPMARSNYTFSMNKTWKTKLIHSDARVPGGFRSLSTPVFRGSTVLFDDAAAVNDGWDQHELGYTYGLYGTPTVLELGARVCELENGFRTFITPGGQGAISLIYLALLKAGDHVLVPTSIYGPNRHFAKRVMQRFGVE